MKTIAFSNKGNYWTTRYSFVSSCIGWIKDHMVTSPTLAQAKEVLWKHDGSSDDNNKFYGVSYNSVIAATFSQAPSVNKQYKAFSIESANPANLAGSNLFIPNKGGQNVVPKETTIGKLTERGGIIYGHIGQENRITMSNSLLVRHLQRKKLHSLVLLLALCFLSFRLKNILQEVFSLLRLQTIQRYSKKIHLFMV